MENKNRLILIILAVVLVIFAGIYFVMHKNEMEGGDITGPTAGDEGSVLPKEMITDDFSIALPAEWEQVEPAIGVTAMAVNMQEEISDPTAREIGFSSYLAVLADTLGERDMAEYAQATRSSLQETIESIVFSADESLTINGKESYLLEAEIAQEGIDFKVLIALIQGADDDVWTVTFNTTQADWEKHRDVFYDMAQSFAVFE